MNPKPCRNLLVFSFLIAILPMYAQEHPDNFPSHTISNGQVTMKINLPDVEKGSYRATRFDWSGLIASVKYNNHEYFGYWKTERDPTFHEDITGPAESYWKSGLGYEEAQPGEGFVRIGVGILEKPDEEAYQSFDTYIILDHGEWSVLTGKDWVEFIHKLDSDFGYGYVYTKKIELTKKTPGFVISHTLKNTGSKKIETDQYNHNFFMIDGEATGPNIEVSFPYAVSCENDLKGLLHIEKDKFVIDQTFENNFVWMELEGYGDSAADHGFTVRNKKTGAVVRMSMDRPLYRMTFWANPVTYCPENCLWISVEPGKRFSWKARYDLED